MQKILLSVLCLLVSAGICAAAGVSDDATAVYWNPAGLNRVEGRAGFNTGAGNLTLGLGWIYQKYNLDIAFSPYDDLGTAIKLSAGLKF